MENENIVMLKRHFVNYKDPKTTAYYLNQCDVLADFEIIETTSRSFDLDFKSQISPMYLGPCQASDGVTCNVFETLWQCAKVYPCHVDENGDPTTEYFNWRNYHFSKPAPALNNKKEIKQLRYPNIELGMDHKSALYSYWFNEETGKYEKLDYVTARKRIYIPIYAKLVSQTQALKDLKHKVDSGIKIALLDFDGFNLYSDSVKAKMYEKYLQDCKKTKVVPSRTLDDYISLKTVKDVINCSFLSVGHGFVLKALLQGDMEVKDGEIIDHTGLLE